MDLIERGGQIEHVAPFRRKALQAEARVRDADRAHRLRTLLRQALGFDLERKFPQSRQVEGAPYQLAEFDDLLRVQQAGRAAAEEDCRNRHTLQVDQIRFQTKFGEQAREVFIDDGAARIAAPRKWTEVANRVAKRNMKIQRARPHMARRLVPDLRHGRSRARFALVRKEEVVDRQLAIEFDARAA